MQSLGEAVLTLVLTPVWLRDYTGQSAQKPWPYGELASLVYCTAISVTSAAFGKAAGT